MRPAARRRACEYGRLVESVADLFAYGGFGESRRGVLCGHGKPPVTSLLDAAAMGVIAQPGAGGELADLRVRALRVGDVPELEEELECLAVEI